MGRKPMPRYRLREVEKRFGMPVRLLLQDLYMARHMTIQQVADELRVSRTQINRWMVLFDIPRRHARWDYDAQRQEVAK